MKKLVKGVKIVSIFLMLILTISLVYASEWISFDGTDVIAPPYVETLESNSSYTTVRIVIPGAYSEERVKDSQTYKTLRFPEYYTMTNVGEPALPAVTGLIGIPPTAAVSVTVIDSSVVFPFSGLKVYPYQKDQIEGTEVDTFYIDNSLYSTDEFYPSKKAEMGIPAIFRDIRVSQLSVYPVIFNPVTDSLIAYRDITVRIDYTGRDDRNILYYQRDSVSPSFYNMYKNLVFNFDFLNITRDDFYKGYLIITLEEYLDEIQLLADWKHQKGIPTTIETVTAGTNYNTIKNIIQQYYDNDQIEFVLLVGDENDISLYNEYTYNQDFDPIVSDYWYSLLDGTDDLPEISIGRLSPNTNEDVTTMVNKIFAYERYPAAGWNVKNLLLVAHKQQNDYSGYYEDYPYQRCKEEIEDPYSLDYGYNVLSCYGAETPIGDEATNQDVRNLMQNVGIVNYRGHGNGYWPDFGLYYANRWDYWNSDNECFTYMIADTLTNPYFPIIYNVSCLNGLIDSDDDSPCLAESFTRNPNGGAAGSLGPSRASFRNADHYFDQKLFKAPEKQNPIYEMGNIINFAKLCMILNPPDNEHWKALANARMFLWFGDPQMPIWTEQPSALNVYHIEEINEPGPAQVTVTVHDEGDDPLQDALVCLYKDDEFYESGFTNFAGQVSFDLYIETYSEGILKVTATQFNFKPYEGSIEIHFPPCAPENLQIQNSGNAMILTWSPVIEDIAGNPENVDNYWIYYNTEDPYSTSFEPCATPYDTTFTDNIFPLIHNKVFYRVTAESYLSRAEIPVKKEEKLHLEKLSEEIRTKFKKKLRKELKE